MVGAAIGAAIVVAASSLAASAPAAAGQAMAAENLSSIIRGGHLYDNWYAELGVRPPKESHPSYPADMTYVKSPAENWRCRECHGWDYKGKDGAYATGVHYTGIKGISGMAGADPEKIIAILKDDTHRYGDKLEEQDFRDLAAFVSEGQVDMDAYIDRETGQAKGDAAGHKNYFTTLCSNCHGREGLKQTGMPALGTVARDNPWGALHTILNGHPGKEMPAMRGFDRQVVAGLLAYIQTLPAEVEMLSSVIRGGRLYDNWYRTIKSPPPTTSHPAYPKDKAFAADPAANWRCSECHGWDYKGKDGVYKSGPHYTGIKGIRDMARADPDAIAAILKDDTHGFDKVLERHDIADLANFVSRGQVEMDDFIDPETGLAKGDKKRYGIYYQTICATCHGKDGVRYGTMPQPLGDIAVRNPWGALHKMLNGHPAGRMPALRVLDMSIVADILAYVQTLPAEDEEMSSIVRGARLYDNWYRFIGAKPPRQPHPLYPQDRKYAASSRTNWRCKECHGWDYKGKDGAYGTGVHYTGIKGIRAMAGAPVERIISILKDPSHGYAGLLSERDFRDLANFVSKGQFDMDLYVDPKTKRAKGDAERQVSYYNTICADCHGKNGAKVITMLALGKMTNRDPWRALHRIVNGLPDEAMGGLRVLGLRISADILAHAQSLPADLVPRSD